MHFKGYAAYPFDFSTINADKGYIGFFICFYDDIHSKPFEENCYLYGISWGGKLTFEKTGEDIRLNV
jgi:hypothetical protein